MRAERELRDAGVPAPRSDARWLVERVSGYDGAELLLGGAEPATDVAVLRCDEMVRRRIAGEPIQYVLGRWQFLELDLMVDRRVLIPRPETEVVARVAVEEAVRLGARRGAADPWAGSTDHVVVDLGTGSGALALALAAELADAEVWATDLSVEALAVARANLAGIGSAATRVRLAAGSWYEALPPELAGRVRVIVANPPYVAEAEVADLPRDVADWEPRAALVSGPTGLEAIEAVIAGAFAWFEPEGGALVVELAPHQAVAARALAAAAGFDEVDVRRDLTGRERVLVARARG